MRINAKDLRLGNLLQYKDIFAPVNSIWGNGNYELHSAMLQFFFVDEYDEEVTGILITEDWLSKFGFAQSADMPEFEHDVWDCTVRFAWYEQSQIWFDGKLLCNFMYVHELQNIFKGLTGTELTLKN